MPLKFICSSEYLRLEPNDFELPRNLEIFICDWMTEHGVYEVRFSVYPDESPDWG